MSMSISSVSSAYTAQTDLQNSQTQKSTAPSPQSTTVQDKVSLSPAGQQALKDVDHDGDSK